MKRLLLIACAFLLAACAGTPAPRGANDAIAYGYGQLAAVRDTTAQLLAADRITVADAKRVQETADQVRLALDAARTAAAIGDAPTVQAKLAAGLELLGQVESFLQARGAQ